ncbi:putative Rho-type GTPase-activating protein [Lachnellula willkommii]|uniref:Putative Rho-type GTPase-activating protein n=1 Tax=Lachnellula willkommii TaxID=215461 RepID=A0A559MA48_9HELO|nr:putative Rho-type GTPase-activating protein [Lachnellula willkommii]
MDIEKDMAHQPRKPNPPQPLSLGVGSNFNNPQSQQLSSTIDSPSPKSPLSPISPKSPKSPFRLSTKKGQYQGEHPSIQLQPAESQPSRTTLPPSQNAVSLPSLQQYSDNAAVGPERQERDRPARTGFFSNYKASKSSSRIQNSDTIRHVTEDTMSRDTERPTMSGRVPSQEHARTESSVDRSTVRKPVGGAAKSDASLNTTADPPPASSNPNILKKNKPKPFSLLSRTRSIRDEQSPRELSPTDKPTAPERAQTSHAHSNSMKTAPLRSETDRSFREMMSSNVRQHSEDRKHTQTRDSSRGKDGRENGRLQPSQVKDTNQNGRIQTFSSSLRDSGVHHTFLNNLKSSATKGAGAISKGLFGKGSRSGSTNEREAPVDDEHYELKVINRPLIEQTRLTRISKKLEDSRDKTEFWMPAFPWRAIDYLNYKGSDVEGLYRVPGSGPQIKRWQRRFDEELDIDLFEQDDLYDINIIGSMLKAWLRELPDELLPKAAQDRIARECNGSETVPQLLIDELSNLSPFNYYLLFAITCHLSLLLAHSEKNKMDFRNLCICFQPCMKIDAFCFKFLVCDWRDCWKGCKTEGYYTEQEYLLFDILPPSSAEGQSSIAVESHDERNVSSSDSSKPSSVSIDNQGQKSTQAQNAAKKLPSSQSTGSMSTVSTNLTVVQERTPPRRNGDMRPLSPIKPLSPIGF